MKSSTRDTNTTVITATLTQKEVESILCEAILQTEGRCVPHEAVKISLGDRYNDRSGTIAPIEFVYDVTVTIDNTKLPKADAEA